MKTLLYLAYSLRDCLLRLNKTISDDNLPAKEEIDNMERFLSQIIEIGGLAFDITCAVEDERVRIARDIHDGPAQVFVDGCRRIEYCLKLLEIADADLSPDVREILKPVIEELEGLIKRFRASSREIRDMIFQLRPPALSELGLNCVITSLVESTERDKQIKGKLTIEGTDGNIPFPIAINLYRIVQESINNIVKYSKALSYEVYINFDKNAIKLEIKDNGQGFHLPSNIKDLLKKKSMGICNMSDRVNSLGGRLEIKSTQGEGTEINAVIPLIDKPL